MNDGYIKLYRKIMDNPHMKDPEFLAVWVHLLLLATHKEVDVLWNGRRTRLKPGQFLSGRLKISKKTGVSDSKVFRIIKTLKIEHQIEQQTSGRNSLFTIVNWHEYQALEHQNKQLVNSSRTAREQLVNTNKNVKKEKNIKKPPYSPPTNIGADEVEETGGQGDFSSKIEEKKITPEKAIEALNEYYPSWDFASKLKSRHSRFKLTTGLEGVSQFVLENHIRCIKADRKIRDPFSALLNRLKEKKLWNSGDDGGDSLLKSPDRSFGAHLEAKQDGERYNFKRDGLNQLRDEVWTMAKEEAWAVWSEKFEDYTKEGQPA